MKIESLVHKLIYLVLFYLGITFVLFPIANTLWLSLVSKTGEVSISQYSVFFETPVMITALKNTLIVGIVTVIML